MPATTIILGSNSRMRRGLLERLQIPFIQTSPLHEEIRIPGESATDMALRLAEGKARSIPVDHREKYIIIGSDQVAHVDGAVLYKPGNHERAVRQLLQSANRWVTFTTAVCLLDDKSKSVSGVEEYHVKFRQLTRRDIERYLEREQPYDSAGSLHAESLGITLLENTNGRDITTLYGLPLMLLQDLFLRLGIDFIDLR